ncbi:MAG: hypothetical protein F6K19_14030 [Cyanothece sp. SIO1E1]|nr:hypothetical protein [Cyanothece sp. SIO1E1]
MCLDSDEFNGPEVDRSKWQTQLYYGRNNPANKEAQYYVDDAFEFVDGVLCIRAEKKSIEGFDYTSGVLSSHKSFAFKTYSPDSPACVNQPRCGRLLAR